MTQTLFRAKLLFCGAAFVASLVSASAFAQARSLDPGKREYDTNCAVCHGENGKGNGSFAELLRRSPTDLTQLAKNNKGVLPISRLYEVIDGASVPGHGARDMPIWGREFKAQDAEYYLEARGQYDAQALVRARILLLLDYINRMQVR